MTNVTVYSRKAVQTLIEHGVFPSDAAVISFYDPPDLSPDDYKPVDYSGVADTVFYAEVPDLDWDAFENDNSALLAFFPQAKELAAFIRKAHQDGRAIICQCDYGQSRSAGCAMAILEYFDHAGKTIFEDPRFYPNQLIFGKVLSALQHGGRT